MTHFDTLQHLSTFVHTIVSAKQKVNDKCGGSKRGRKKVVHRFCVPGSCEEFKLSSSCFSQRVVHRDEQAKHVEPVRQKETLLSLRFSFKPQKKKQCVINS